MDHLVYDIAYFYAMVVRTLSDASLTSVVAISGTALWGAAGAIYLLWRYLDWVGDQTNSVKTFVFFFRTNAKLFAVYFLVLGSPAIFGTMTAWTSARVIEAANGPMTDATQKLFSQMGDTTMAMTSLEGAYANALYDANPATNFMSGYGILDATGITDTQKQIALENALASQAAATRDLEAQLKNAKEMAASDNADRARLGGQIVAGIQQKISENKATIDDLKAKAQPAKPAKQDEGLTAGLLAPLKGLYALVMNFASISYGAGWMAFYHVISIVTLLPGILLGLWGMWKLIGASVELFSYLFSFAAKVIVGGMISIGLAPISMLSLLFPATQEYGRHLISWWGQVIMASITLGIVVHLGAFGIGSITDSVGGLTVELTRNLLGGLSGTASGGGNIIEAISAGTALLAVGYAFSFLTQYVKGSVAAGAGLVSGHFHA